MRALVGFTPFREGLPLVDLMQRDNKGRLAFA